MSQVPTRKGVRCPQNGFLFPTVDGSEIPSPTTWDFLKTLANNGINYQPQLVIAGFLKHQLYHWLVPVSAHTIHAWYIYLHIRHKIQPNEGKFRGFLSNPTLIFFPLFQCQKVQLLPASWVSSQRWERRCCWNSPREPFCWSQATWSWTWEEMKHDYSLQINMGTWSILKEVDNPNVKEDKLTKVPGRWIGISSGAYLIWFIPKNPDPSQNS